MTGTARILLLCVNKCDYKPYLEHLAFSLENLVQVKKLLLAVSHDERTKKVGQGNGTGWPSVSAIRQMRCHVG